MTISETDVETLAKKAKRVRTEEGTVEERSVDELIKADQYSNQKSASEAVPWGMRFARTKPGGTVVALLIAVGILLFATTRDVAAQGQCRPGMACWNGGGSGMVCQGGICYPRGSGFMPAGQVQGTMNTSHIVRPTVKLFPWNWGGDVYRVRQRNVFVPQGQVSQPPSGQQGWQPTPYQPTPYEPVPYEPTPYNPTPYEPQPANTSQRLVTVRNVPCFCKCGPECKCGPNCKCLTSAVAVLAGN